MLRGHYWIFAILIILLSCNDVPKKEGQKRGVPDIEDVVPGINVIAKEGLVIPCNNPVINKAGKPISPKTLNNSAIGYVPMVNYNTEQGLSLSSISCSYTDDKGGLWFGTYGGGISYYDGKSMTNFTTAQGLSKNTIYSIVEDRNGGFWFGTDGNGIDYYNGKKIINYSTRQGLVNNVVRVLVQDKRGEIWIGTDKGVSCYDGKSFKRYSTGKGIFSRGVRSIYEDKNDNLWFGTNGGGICCYNGKSFVSYSITDGLADNVVLSIAEDNAGNMWFGTRKGISTFNGRNFINYPVNNEIVDNDICKIIKDHKGNMWFASLGKGVYCYDGKSFIQYTNNNSGLASDFVTTITEDGANNLWFGTLGNGISRYDGQALSYYTTAHGLPGNHVRTIWEDKKGTLWIGTDREGLSRYDGNSFSNYSVAQGLPNNNVWCGTEDKNGNLWLGTYGGGISCFDGRNFKNYSTKQGLPSDKILFVINDRKGNIWFGTDTGGIICYNGTAFINYTTKQGLVNNSVWCGYEDRKGNLWFGTAGGISCYNGEMFTNYSRDQGVGNNTILCIEEDGKDNLWFGTDGDGLLRYDGKSLYGITTRNGLANDEVYDIVMDKQGDMVLGTNLGFSVLKGFVQKQKNSEHYYTTINKIASSSGTSNAELRKYYAPIFEKYSEETGYPIKDINANAMFCDSKGIIWAGCGDNKLVRFNYDAVFRDTTAPFALIQSLKINNEEVNWYDFWERSNKQDSKSGGIAAGKTGEVIQYGHTLNDSEQGKIRKALKDVQFNGLMPFSFLPQNLILPYSDNEITFEFSAIAPAKYSLIRYQYILEGYDKVWSPVTDKTTATFGNIPGGSYVFNVRARNVYGVWSKPVSYSFKVLPPWYRTWWAYCLYVLFLLSSIRLYAYWREKRLTSEKERLQEIVKEQQRAEEKLKHSEIRLKQAQEIAHLGSWEVNFATGTSIWSEETCRIYGLEPSDNSHSFEVWISFIHPDDLDYVMKTIKDSEASLTNTAMFHRIMRRDGTVRHVYSQAQYEIDKEGRSTGLYGVVHDVTELKEHEEEIRKSNERFKLVMKATREAIIDWDIANDTTVWGDGFYELFGYKPSEYHNHLWSDNIHPDDRNRVMRELQKAMHNKNNDGFFAEFRFLKANRKIAYVQHKGIFIRDKSGMPVRAIGSMVDVTSAIERVHKIETQNAALKEIAWIQAHLVRAPLATLMGLVALMKSKDEYGINEADLIDKIQTEARNLDEIINTVVKKAEAIKSDLKDG